MACAHLPVPTSGFSSPQRRKASDMAVVAGFIRPFELQGTPCTSSWSNAVMASASLALHGASASPRRVVRPLLRLWEPTGLICHNVAAWAAGDDPGNPLGEAGFWDQAEGKEKLNAIEEMRELVAEGEKIQNERNGDAGEDISEDEAQDRAAQLREELAKRAKQQAAQRKEAEVMFQMAQRAYARGTYDKSVELFEAALTNVPKTSNLGGDIQIWLAMAYEADNRHADCIALYKRIENTHPNKATRRQAADLRYILEAPKLKISKDEMVSIPLIGSDDDRSAKTWSQMVKERRKPKAKKGPDTHDYLEDWLVWNPPRWEKNPYFWVAFSIWLTLVAIALLYQK